MPLASSAFAEFVIGSVTGLCVPMVTLTLTPATVPVLPSIVKPDVFSAKLILPSPVIAVTFSVSVPSGCTVTVTVFVPRL